jgi:hypothetical protein
MKLRKLMTEVIVGLALLTAYVAFEYVVKKKT